MQKQFLSNLSIPERTCGEYQICHTRIPKGSKITIVSRRNGIFDGRRPTFAIADQDYYKHELLQDGAVWMSDSLQELEQARQLAQQLHGNVLIGGLGLGLVLQVLPDHIKSVTVVERAPEVVDLVWNYVHRPKRDRIVIADLFHYVKEINRKQFDCAFLDIWAPTGERALSEYVLPLRFALENVLPQSKIYCWAESEMWGQVHFGLASFVAMHFQTPEFKLDIDHLIRHDNVKAPYYRWFKETQPNERTANAKIHDFIKNPLRWFKKYGDQSLDTGYVR